MGWAPERRAALAPAVLAVLLSTVLATTLATGTAESVTSHPSQGTDSVTVTVGSALQFAPNTIQVTPGDTVDLTIVQTGQTLHTFTLSSVRDYNLSSSSSSAQVAAFFATNPPLVNVTIPGVPQTITRTFTAPPLGTYQFLCMIDSHFQAGMSGILGSGVIVTQPTSSTGPGAPVFIITGVIVSLVVLAIVLGFVVGRRRGSTDEMPPERLGYPEPLAPAGSSKPLAPK